MFSRILIAVTVVVAFVTDAVQVVPKALAEHAKVPKAPPTRKTGATGPGEHDLHLVMLDDQEVERRGSHCLDGSTPGYLHKPGTSDDKWLFWFQGAAWCKSEAECAEELPNIVLQEHDDYPLMKTADYSDFHHVMFQRCDVGMFMGDLSEPVVHGGSKLYFQGKRIIDHVIDTLQKNGSLGSAKEVVIAGGSGGGQASIVIADYFATLMPKSVKKFGVVPMNGWYANGDDDEMKYMFDLANMKTAISPSCAAAFGDDAHKCLDPYNSYKHSTSNIFLVQAFDYTFQWNESTDSPVKDAWANCLNQEATAKASCDNEGVQVLQEYLDNFTDKLQSLPKYNKAGEGGYLFTCTEHQFYDDDDLFTRYSNNGVLLTDAISSWWQSLGTSASSKWHLPCSLGNAANPQCEASCGE